MLSTTQSLSVSKALTDHSFMGSQNSPTRPPAKVPIAEPTIAPTGPKNIPPAMAPIALPIV